MRGAVVGVAGLGVFTWPDVDVSIQREVQDATRTQPPAMPGHSSPSAALPCPAPCLTWLRLTCVCPLPACLAPPPHLGLGRRAPAVPQEGAGPPGEKDGKITWLERYLGNVSSRGFLLSERWAPRAARGTQAACRLELPRRWRKSEGRLPARTICKGRGGEGQRGTGAWGVGRGAWGEGQRASAPPQPAMPRPAVGLTVACAVAVFLL